MNVLFYLPSNGGGGGAHSIVQECIGMRTFGVFPTIAVAPANVAAFRSHYPELNERGVRLVMANDGPSLAAHLGGIDLVCATTFQSVTVVRDALAELSGAKPKAAYYVQDFEPLFCVPGTDNWRTAMASYTLIPDALLFAKTDWLCDIVYRNTGAVVRKVKPSIDHVVYYPEGHLVSETVSISAMIRTKTRRRAPQRTVRILERLSGLYGDRVRIEAFGSSDDEMRRMGIILSDGIVNRGRLQRREVSAVLRASDLFLDLSDFQAFGRTGLEAMACGCVPLLPVFGGTDEYARHWSNAIVVDPRSDETIIQEIGKFVSLTPAQRTAMRNAAIETALDYTTEKAAFSEVSLFTQAIR